MQGVIYQPSQQLAFENSTQGKQRNNTIPHDLTLSPFPPQTSLDHKRFGTVKIWVTVCEDPKLPAALNSINPGEMLPRIWTEQGATTSTHIVVPLVVFTVEKGSQCAGRKFISIGHVLSLQNLPFAASSLGN